MDNRFKPIGGMFQGVRGSTATGGAAKYANFLVKLNDSGEIDLSCLPEDIKKAGDTYAELQEEIGERKEADNDQSDRISTLETIVQEDMATYGYKIQDIYQELECFKETHEHDVAGLNTDIQALQTELSAAESKLAAHTAELSELSQGLRDVESDLSNITVSVASLESRTSATEAETTELRRLLSEISTNLSNITNQVANWASSVTVVSGDLATLSQKVELLATDTAAQFQDNDNRIKSLENNVDMIYSKLFPSQNS